MHSSRVRSHARSGRNSRRPFAVVLFAFALILMTACGGSDDPVTPPGNDDPPAAPGAQIQGAVTHEGAGVGSVQIRLRDGPGPDREVTTPNDGTFSFDDIEPGSWQLEVTPPDYFQLASGEDAARSVQATGGQTATVNVSLAPLAELDIQEIEATSGLAFSPGEVNVAPGTRIRWVNTSTVLHTVTPSDHTEWSEGSIPGQGDTFEAVVNNPGSFDYICVPHQGDGMVGVIVVEP
jgi:plastocyanin